MLIRQFFPSPVLRGSIASYLYYQDAGEFAGARLLSVPSGLPEIAIHFGSEVNSHLNDPGELKQAYVFGSHNDPGVFQSTGPIGFFGILFKPAGITTTLGIPQQEFRNVAVNLEDITEARGGELVDRICSTGGPEEMARAADDYFLSLRKRQMENNSYIAHAVRRIIAVGGSEKIQNIAGELDITTKTLGRNFRKYIGYSPKEFSNVVRFNHAYKLLKNGVRPLDIVCRCGYFDQSHLINEINKYTGLAPRVIATDQSRSFFLNRVYVTEE